MVLMIHDARPATGRRNHDRVAPFRGYRHGTVRHAEEWAQSTELLLHGAAQVEHEMEAIGDLGGLWSAAAYRLGIRAVPIAADDHDVGMGDQPRRHRIGRAHREDVHDLSTLQIHQDRPVMEGQLISARES
jgi:hypothetical protein